MGLFPYTFESEKPHHIKNIFVMGLDKRSLHNSSLIAAGKMVYQDLFSGNSTDGIHSFRECGFFVLVVL